MFKAISAAKFDNCSECTDGMIIWITKQNLKEVALSSVGPKKFYCGRKHKFDLSAQGECDAKGRVLDVSIGHPGSTSDYFALVTSSLHTKLEKMFFAS